MVKSEFTRMAPSRLPPASMPLEPSAVVKLASPSIVASKSMYVDEYVGGNIAMNGWTTVEFRASASSTYLPLNIPVSLLKNGAVASVMLRPNESMISTSFCQMMNWAVPSMKRTRERWKGKWRKAQICWRMEPKCLGDNQSK